MAIGLLDSGVGGLTIWKAIVDRLPDVSTVYVGDSAHCPYGTKTEEEIWELARRLVEFLIARQVSVIVVACNTISVIALEKMRSMYPEMTFIGTVPAIKVAAEQSGTKKIGILSTLRTAGSPYQRSLIEQFASTCTVLNLGTDKLVPLVERGSIDGLSTERVLQEVLQPFQEAKIDTLVLGCTHFPFLRSQVQNILGKEVTLLDSGAAIARHVQRVLEEKRLGIGPVAQHDFFTSGDPTQMGVLLQYLGNCSTIQTVPSLL